MSDTLKMQDGEPLISGIRRPRSLIGPLDWGIAFAWAYRWQILLLCCAPLVAELLASYALYYDRLMRHHLLLIFVGTAATNVWFVISVLLLAVRVASERSLNFGEIGWSALRQLPKPFLSYFAAAALVFLGATALVLPGLVLMGFLLWAPAFAAGESAVVQPSVRKDGEDPLEEQPERGLFQNRSIIDLGLMRSVRLAGKNYPYSVQLVLLMLCAAIAPGVLIDAAVPDNMLFWVQVLKSCASSVITALVVGVWAGTFLMLLPAVAKREIGIQIYPDPRDFYRGAVLPRYEGRMILQGGLLIVALVTTWLFLQGLGERVEIPESTKVTFTSVERRGDEVVADLTFDDPRYNLRWFSPDALVASVPAAVTPAAAPDATSPTLGWWASLAKQSAPATPTTEELEVARYDLILPNGEKLAPDAISPVYEPLRVVIAFKLPSRAVTGDLVVRYGEKRAPFYQGPVPNPSDTPKPGRAEEASTSSSRP